MTIVSIDDSSGNAIWKPDAVVGEKLERGINWGTWLTTENDEISDVEWTIPTGITKVSERVDSNVAYVMLQPTSVGKYVITCTLTSIEGITEQIKIKQINLVVT